MKKALASALALCLALSALATRVPKGTDVRLAFEDEVSSKTARTGDIVSFRVVEDVVVDGQVVISKGTGATGTITQVNKGRRFGVNASIRIRLDKISAVDGTALPIATRNKGKKTGEKTDKAALATAGGALVLGPVGLGIGYFMVGKHVTAKPGDTLTTEVTSDTEVDTGRSGARVDG